jgi:hypothetical protein
LEVVEPGIVSRNQVREYAALHLWIHAGRQLGASELCSMESSHPLEQPWIELVMASDLEVD